MASPVADEMHDNTVSPTGVHELVLGAAAARDLNLAATGNVQCAAVVDDNVAVQEPAAEGETVDVAREGAAAVDVDVPGAAAVDVPTETAPAMPIQEPPAVPSLVLRGEKLTINFFDDGALSDGVLKPT